MQAERRLLLSVLLLSIADGQTGPETTFEELCELLEMDATKMRQLTPAAAKVAFNNLTGDSWLEWSRGGS